MRRIVARYGGCLSALPARQRRVLRLRAGIGPREPASRATVARRLDLPMPAVRRAERRGLRRLVREGRAGCAGPASDGDPAAIAGTAGAGTTLVTGGGAGTTTGGPAARAGDTAGGGDPARAGVTGGGSAAGGANGNGGGAGGVKCLTATNPGPAAPLDITLPLLAVALAGIAAFTAWRLRGPGSD
jgi:Sigma-70, region 4